MKYIKTTRFCKELPFNNMLIDLKIKKNYIYKRRKWQPILVFLPGESHGQRSLVGYSPWGLIKSDLTEAT